MAQIACFFYFSAHHMHMVVKCNAVAVMHYKSLFIVVVAMIAVPCLRRVYAIVSRCGVLTQLLVHRRCSSCQTITHTHTHKHTDCSRQIPTVNCVYNICGTESDSQISCCWFLELFRRCLWVIMSTQVNQVADVNVWVCIYIRGHFMLHLGICMYKRELQCFCFGLLLELPTAWG